MKEPDDLPSLTALDEGLRAFRKKIAPPPRAPREGAGLAAQVGLELVSSVFAGFGLGYLLDSWWGTSPLMMAICLILGAIAGFLTIYRTVIVPDEKDDTNAT